MSWTKLKRIKFQAGKVGRPKYHVSRANVARRVVGPMTMACRSRLVVNVRGNKRRKVIIDVGRRRTANDAKIKEMEILLRQFRYKKRYAFE